MSGVVVVALKDTPYMLVRRLDDQNVELSYGGEIRERWTRVTARREGSPYYIRVGGTPYRFAERLDGR